MQGLIKTIIVMAVLIVVGIGASAYVYADLVGKSTAAQERGVEEGYLQGYLSGLEEGSRVGYQAGSRLGYTRSQIGDFTGGNEPGFYFLYNPTYAEVRAMLAAREKILAEGEKDSAEKIHNYAVANGIRSAYVRSPIARQAAEGMVYLY
ncbi:MAG: hypothetical protein HYU85_02455, partial [Chloroflexi bacterium]|nr:hypothetical protein [Chloroflexota bacterium]